MTDPAPPLLRRAGPSDLDALGEMVAAFHGEEGVVQTDEARRGALAALLADEALGGAWLILSEDAPVGYLVAAYGFSLEFGGRDAFLDEVYVAPAHRGAGLGRRALGLLKAELERRGIRALHLEVGTENPRAAKLYREAGFELRTGYHLMSARLDPR